MACSLMIRSMLTTTKHVLRAQTFTNVQQIMSFSVCRGNLFQVDKSKFKFTDKHEWIQVNGNQGTIGITDYAQVTLKLQVRNVSLLLNHLLVKRINLAKLFMLSCQKPELNLTKRVTNF